MSTQSTQQQPNEQELTKSHLQATAFEELLSADRIFKNGVRLLTQDVRAELSKRCHERGIPEDGSIGYAQARNQFITYSLYRRRSFLRDTIRHLRHVHAAIQLTLNLMSTEQKQQWAKTNERTTYIECGATRANERLELFARFDELEPILYPKKQAVKA